MERLGRLACQSDVKNAVRKVLAERASIAGIVVALATSCATVRKTEAGCRGGNLYNRGDKFPKML